MKKVAIIMGSDSDLPVLEKSIQTLKDFGVPYEVHIFSAHRTPVEAKEFSENARRNGFGVIIASGTEEQIVTRFDSDCCPFAFAAAVINCCQRGAAVKCIGGDAVRRVRDHNIG